MAKRSKHNRNRVKCERYKAQGRREKNKARRMAAYMRRMNLALIARARREAA